MSDAAMVENDAATEARARNMGWRPESEWDEERARREGRTKPTKFLTAAEYIARNEASLPLLRQENRKQAEELTALRGQVGELTGKLDETGKLVQSLHDQNKAVGQRAYERGKAEAEEKMRKAVEEADTTAFDAAKADLDRIEKEHAEAAPQSPPPPPPPPPPVDDAEARRQAALAKVDPETRGWIGENSWFDSDHMLNSTMIHEHGRVKAEMPGLGVREALDEAKRRVVAKFPEKFGINPARDAPPSALNPSGNGSRDGKKTFADVPEADKQSFYRMQKFMKDKNGTDYTEDEFLADYQWS